MKRVYALNAAFTAMWLPPIVIAFWGQPVWLASLLPVPCFLAGWTLRHTVQEERDVIDAEQAIAERWNTFNRKDV